jgi:hypothetical protein
VLQETPTVIPERFYCALGKNCLYTRMKAKKRKAGAQSQIIVSGRQYRLVPAVKKHSDCFLRCGHFACGTIPKDMEWDEGEEPKSCAEQHLSDCILKNMSLGKWKFYSDFVKMLASKEARERRLRRTQKKRKRVCD